MALLATIYFEPTFTWQELASTVAWHVIMAVLIGLAFRHHVDDLPSVFGFAACVAGWWVSQFGMTVVELAHVAASLSPTVDDPLFSLELGLVLSIREGSILFAIAIYTWVFQHRHGESALGRFLWTLGITGFVRGLWILVSWLQVIPDSEAFRITERGTWFFRMGTALEYGELPEWSSVIGWIIGYVGLFGGKQKLSDGVEPVGFMAAGTSP